MVCKTGFKHRLIPKELDQQFVEDDRGRMQIWGREDARETREPAQEDEPQPESVCGCDSALTHATAQAFLFPHFTRPVREEDSCGSLEGQREGSNGLR